MATVGQGESSSSSFHPFQRMNGHSAHNEHEPGYAGGQMRSKLQALLDDKERQLQKAEALSQRILAQQMELEERINQITELDEHGGTGQDGESELRSQLDELAQTMHGWATENDSLWAGAVTKDGPGGPQDLSQFEADGETVINTPSAAQSSRRAKNAAHRANDVEFAFEIGSGLLTEIRRLQSLLAERDKSLLDMKEEKDDMDRSLDSLRTALRTQEANAEKFREENWNLEVTLQELRSTLSDTQATLQRAETENKRAQKQLTTFREAAEGNKTEAERLATLLDETKSRHETDVAQMRKQAATLQREKGELQTNVENLKAEVAKKTRTVARYGSPMTPNDPKFLTPARPNEAAEEENEDVFGTAASTRRRMDNSLVFGDTFDAELDALSPETSPIKNPAAAAAARSPIVPNHVASELESLKQSLAHAHRQIGTLKGSLNRERQLRTEYGRKLEGMGAAVPVPEGFEDDHDEDYEDEPGELPRVTPLRSGRGRGAKFRSNPTRANTRTSLAVKLALAEKAGQAAHQYDSVGPRSNDGHELPVADFSMGDQEEWVDVDEDGFASRRKSEDRDSVATAASETEIEGGDLVGRRLRSQSAISVGSSMDGMDPAYAHVLKGPRESTRTSSDMGYRKSTDSASGYTGTRAGNALAALMGQSRPGSVFDAPGTLASELGGLADAGTVGNEDRLREELGLGDEEDDVTPEGHHIGEDVLFEDIPAIAPVPVKPPVEMAEMSIQCELLLPPPPAPVIERTTISVQTVEIPPPSPPVTDEISVQTDTLPEPEKVAVVAAAAPAPVRQYADSSTGTDPVASPPGGRRVPLEIIGAVAGGAAGAAIANKRDSVASKRASLSSKRNSVASKRDSKLPPSAFKDPVVAASSSRRSNRTDTDTEGDTDYEDARETVGGTTPTQSLNEYHSMNDFENSDEGSGSESDSAESIKVSRMHVKRPGIGTSADAEATARDAMSRAEETSKRDTIVPATKMEEAKPKPEVKDTSVQTDDWTPPIPAGTTLFALGPQARQFQFIPGPTSPGVSTIALPTGAAVVAGATATATAATTATALKAPGSQRPGIIGSSPSGSLSGDAARPRLPSATLSPNAVPKAVDRTRPPTMMLPPPPRLPPPPPTTVPPTTTTTTKPGPPNMGPPPRPTSPPPAELIQRATTPSISRNSTLAVPPVVGGRTISQSRSIASSSAATTAPTRQQSGEHGVLPDPFDDNAGRPALKSMSSAAPSRRSVSSRRQSISSSISSDHGVRMADTSRSTALPIASGSNGVVSGGVLSGMQSVMSRSGPRAENATDPMIIHAITQTMIGEFLYKYTRKAIGKKHAERRHRRYFWIHPYTKTIYWSAVDPGSSNVTESSAKSAYIESVKAVMDPNPMPPGLHQYSVVVTTANREMKFTAPTKERHDIWFNALSYLLARPSAINQQPTAREPLSPTSVNTQPRPPPGAGSENETSYPGKQAGESRHFDHSPRSQRSGGSALTVDSWNGTQRPAGTRSLSRMSNPYGSVGKRSGTAAAEFMRWDVPASPPPQHEDEAVDFHLHDHEDAYDGLDNVRACCDGKHDVGSLTSRYHPPHHNHSQQQQNNYGQQQQQQYRGTVRSTSEVIPDRPASPSGWSFRSGRSKGGSQENGGVFSWSRRSRQSSAVRP